MDSVYETRETVEWMTGFIKTACDVIQDRTSIEKAGAIASDVESSTNRYYVVLPHDEASIRHIFEDGQYKGCYDPNLAEVLS